MKVFFRYLLIYLVLYPAQSKAQNLLFNPGFEYYGLYGWGTVKTVDELVSNELCHPASGSGFIGLRTRSGYADEPNWQEYVYQDIPQLTPGAYYMISFKVSPCEASNFISDDIGLAFISKPDLDFYNAEETFQHTASIIHNDGTPITDFDGWTTISGAYKATGLETHIAIGAFKTDTTLTIIPYDNGYQCPKYNFVIFYVDDVSLTICHNPPNPDLGPDLSWCEADSATFNSYFQTSSYFPKTTYLWSTGSTDSSITVHEPDRYYWVDVTGQDCTIRDSVYINQFSKGNLGPDRVVCSNNFPVVLTIPQKQNETIIWNDGSTDLPKYVKEGGIYSITKTYGTCSLQDTIRIVDFENEIRLYPNPVLEEVFIENYSEAHITGIAAMDGKELLNANLPLSDALEAIPRLPAGMYFITLEHDYCKILQKVEVISH